MAEVKVVTKSGYYMHHREYEEKEWGSLVGLNTGSNIKKDYPKLYGDILSKGKGTVFLPIGGDEKC